MFSETITTNITTVSDDSGVEPTSVESDGSYFGIGSSAKLKSVIV